MGIPEGGLSVNEGDELMAEQSFDSAAQLLHHCILASCHSLEVKVIREPGDSEGLRFTEAVDHFCILAERLGRDAAFIQTCTSYMSGFDQHDLHSPFCSQQGSLISARPGTYDDYFHISKL